MGCGSSKYQSNGYLWDMHYLEYSFDFNSLVNTVLISASIPFPWSSNMHFVLTFDGLWNATTQATLSRNGFAMLVSCCVKTQTDNPSCLPENASLMNSLLLFFSSFDTAQSSKIISVFVPLNKVLHACSNSSTCSKSTGQNTKNRGSPRANPRYVLLWM